MSALRRQTAWPWIAIVLGLLAMAPSLVMRVAVEQANTVFEHSMPDEELTALSRLASSRMSCTAS